MRKHANENFESRHIGPDQADTAKMLNAINATSLSSLMSETIPQAIRMEGELKIAEALSEEELLKHLREVASQNAIFRSYIGMGYYNCFTPKVILRNIFENPGWYTQYTPYQAEISQGRLEALINYQTMLTELTGLPLSNSSLLDEGTAAAEAMGMLWSKSKKKHGRVFFVDKDCFPQTIDILKTRSEPLGIEVEVGDINQFTGDDQHFGMLLQYPNAKGEVKDYSGVIEKAQGEGVGVAVAADLLSLVLLEAPGKWGVDIVLGSTQRFGIPLGYGGPHAAYLTAKEEYKRLMPGRIIGVSLDAQGNPALRMALQTREQHIKRDRATSNICTAQVLLAIMAGMYAVYHGREGLQRIANHVHSATSALGSQLEKLGYTLHSKSFFDTLFIEDLEQSQIEKIEKLSTAKEINFNYFYPGSVGISLDETVTSSDVLDIIDIFASVQGKGESCTLDDLHNYNGSNLTSTLLREDQFFSSYEVFSKYRSETEMLRYIKRLETKDLSLAHSMIPLGSCTMKLNATTEMIPVSWPEYASIHPFVPAAQAKGYQKLFKELEAQLCEVTGFDAVSLQPNAGAQGEYSGLLVIRGYHISNGEGHRNISLIPSSAHGTNPASAVMAGMKVVVVECDDAGNIDLTDLKQKAEKHADNLSSLMVTYPSTHGVFEEDIIEICDIIHKHGGQVYMDGANMNAQVGLTSPGLIGADVCHLNLHKTFCIPHGGGGPGMGPIGVRKHLAPFLPGHSVVSDAGLPIGNSAVSAAPWGSASILLISYAYIKMMGAKGLRYATEYAILNSNYIKEKLLPYYSILYTGKSGRTAHEFIVDFRDFKKSCGVEVEDVAKRLMDYGFHAPTMSFPVAGTIMIEPTESESLEELDRFCDALIQIRKEISKMEKGEWDLDNNPLKNAPHTLAVVSADKWELPYSRKVAAYPLSWIEERKFWPSVARINNSYGDRNLVCTCPSPDMYREENIAEAN